MSFVVAAPDGSAANCTIARRAYSTVWENMLIFYLKLTGGARSARKGLGTPFAGVPQTLF
jgi:hypothetical protein